MKKLLATAIAGTLLVTATGAAMARPYHGYGHYDRGYHHGNAGAAIGLGLGLFALGAVIASSNRDYGPAYYAPPPPRLLRRRSIVTAMTATTITAGRPAFLNTARLPPPAGAVSVSADR